MISSKVVACTNQPAVFIDMQALVDIWQGLQTSLTKKKPVKVWQWCYDSFWWRYRLVMKANLTVCIWREFWQMWRQIVIISELMMFTMHIIPKLVWWSVLWYYLLILRRKRWCFMLIIILFPCHAPSPVIPVLFFKF